MNPADSTQSAERKAVYDLLVRKYSADPEKLENNTHLFLDLGLESLDFIDLISDLEARLSISIPDRDAPRLQEVGAIVGYLERKEYLQTSTSQDSHKTPEIDLEFAV